MDRIYNIYCMMTFLEPLAYCAFEFRDVVSGKFVNSYKTQNGTRYLATSRWSRFRVKAANQHKEGV